MFFQIRIAGKNIGISCRHDWTYNMCKSYLSDSLCTDFDIEISQSDIEHERLRVVDENATYSDGYLESLAVYRKITEHLIDDDILLFHGTVIGVNGTAIMLSAPSGIGKTTFSELWLKSIDNAYILNGDKPLVQVTDNAAIAFGTPWCGKENRNTNCSEQLKHICFIERGDKNEIQQILFNEALPQLLSQVYRPKDPAKLKKTIMLLTKMAKHTRFYRLSLKYYENLADMEQGAALNSFQYMLDRE